MPRALRRERVECRPGASLRELTDNGASAASNRPQLTIIIVPAANNPLVRKCRLFIRYSPLEQRFSQFNCHGMFSI